MSVVIGRLPLERGAVLNNALIAGGSILALAHPLPFVVRALAACVVIALLVRESAQFRRALSNP